MKIAKPMLLIITPLGVAGGLYEAYRFAGGLAVLMAALLSLITVAMLTVVFTIRRERRAERDAESKNLTQSHRDTELKK